MVKPQVPGRRMHGESGVLYRVSDRALTGSNGRAWGPGLEASQRREGRRRRAQSSGPGSLRRGLFGPTLQQARSCCSSALCETRTHRITGAGPVQHSHNSMRKPSFCDPVQKLALAQSGCD